MKYFMLFATILFTIYLPAQTPLLNEPQNIVVDSKDNVFATLKYGIPVYTQRDSSKAEFVSPETIITNKKGEIIFTDERLHRVIKLANGKVSTLAGNNIIDPCAQNIGGRAQEGYKDGKALTALFNFPKGLAYDSKGNLFIADSNNYCIRKLSPDGMVTTFAK